MPQATASTGPVGTVSGMTATTPLDTVGTVYLPSSPGTPVGEFSFLVDREYGDRVAVGTPVSADTVEGTAIGTVTDLVTVGADRDPLSASYAQGNSGFGSLGERSDVIVAKVQVFHAPAMRPIRAGNVRPSTAQEIGLASGLPRIAWPIPAGVVELANGEYAPLCLDGHTLLGPESAHLNIGGLSGQASKTSYAGFLLRSAIHAGSPEQDSTGAIIFNVKGQDLVNLDEPASGGKYALTDADLAMYAAMNIPATPFDDVTVYAPSLPGGTGTRSSKETAAPLRWDLNMVWPYLRYFFPGLYESENMAAFLGDFESRLLRSEDPGKRIDTFDGLEKFMDSELEKAEQEDSMNGWRSHHVATMRKARKLLMSLPERCGGLLTRGKAKSSDDVPVERWRHGQVVVVDIAGLDTLVQAAVIARTSKRLLESAEGGTLGIDHLVLFADELNLFAPAQGGDLAPVRKILRTISATGRYAGLSLWGAGQFLSQVDPQILGNAATRAVGILSESELESGVYGRLPAGQRERVVTLPKGQMALKAYNLRGQMVVSFPRPAWATGKDTGTGRPRPAISTALGLSQASLERLTEGIPHETIERVVARADDPAKAIAALDQLREPDMRKVSVDTGSTYNSSNPFDLD